jgi:hypothetical protein
MRIGCHEETSVVRPAGWCIGQYDGADNSPTGSEARRPAVLARDQPTDALMCLIVEETP